MSLKSELRAALRKAPDGLTSGQLMKLLNQPGSAISRSLESMDDAYIDRWAYKGSGTKRLQAVWCVVEVPEDCPRPEQEVAA